MANWWDKNLTDKQKFRLQEPKDPSLLDVVSTVPNPVGDVASGLLAAQDVSKGNYGSAALNSLGLLPFVPSMGASIKNVGKSAKTEFELAHDLAQQRAALPIAKGGLGLPASNTAMDRAKAMGFDTDVYHGTNQNIIGGFNPVYSDNLTFTTPNPQFASDWIGKGAKQKRTGDVAEKEREQAYQEYKAIREKIMNPNTLNNLEGEAFKKEYDMRRALAQEELKKAGLSKMDSSIHGNILPLKSRVKNTFNPSTDYEVMSDYIKSTFPNETPNGNVLNMFKSGDYIVYETPKAVEALKNRGYDSMMLRESASQPNSTLAIFDPSLIRSRFAAFDPFRRNEADILAGVAPLAVGGLLGLNTYNNMQEKPKKEKKTK